MGSTTSKSNVFILSSFGKPVRSFSLHDFEHPRESCKLPRTLTNGAADIEICRARASTTFLAGLRRWVELAPYIPPSQQPVQDCILDLRSRTSGWRWVRGA